MAFKSEEDARAYWRSSKRLIGTMLAIWFTVSFVCGIMLVDVLNLFTIGGYKLGFWFAQQGSIYVFVALIFIYAWRMTKLDKQFHVEETEAGEAKEGEAG